MNAPNQANSHSLQRPRLDNVELASLSDWELAMAAPCGNEAAYEALLTKYEGPVRQFIARSVKNKETARDLAQEVFLKAWFGLPHVRSDGRFTTWLFQIAVNVCRDYAKSKVARNDRMTQSFLRGSDGELLRDQEFPHPNASPDRLVEEAEAVAALEGEIRTLPENLRTAWSSGLSPKAIEVRVYRARRILHQRIERWNFALKAD